MELEELVVDREEATSTMIDEIEVSSKRSRIDIEVGHEECKLSKVKVAEVDSEALSVEGGDFAESGPPEKNLQNTIKVSELMNTVIKHALSSEQWDKSIKDEVAALISNRAYFDMSGSSSQDRQKYETLMNTAETLAKIDDEVLILFFFTLFGCDFECVCSLLPLSILTISLFSFQRLERLIPIVKS